MPRQPIHYPVLVAKKGSLGVNNAQEEAVLALGEQFKLGLPGSARVCAAKTELAIVPRRKSRRGIIYIALARRQDRSGIEDVLRIERLLQRLHALDRPGAEFRVENYYTKPAAKPLQFLSIVTNSPHHSTANAGIVRQVKFRLVLH
jgi:hypothetical protein